MTDVDDEARALVEAAEIASAAAAELLTQLDVLETFVDDAKRAEREGIRSRGTEALLWQAAQQLDAVRHVVKRFEDLHKKVPATVAELKTKPRTLDAVVKGLRRYKRTFAAAALFQGSAEFQLSSAKRYMRLVMPDDHAGREELDASLSAAQDAVEAMDEGVAGVMNATGWNER